MSVPSCAMTSNLRSARRRLRANRVRVGRVEVAERLVEVDRQAEVGAAGGAARRGDHGEATRSGSKISIPSNPAAAAAASLSSSVPDRHTVAIARRRRPVSRPGRRSPGASTSSVKWASIRSASGSTPVNSRNASTAW